MRQGLAFDYLKHKPGVWLLMECGILNLVYRYQNEEGEPMVSIQYIIDFFMEPAVLPENTVDRLEFGKPEEPVQGIAVSYLANQSVS